MEEWRKAGGVQEFKINVWERERETGQSRRIDGSLRGSKCGITGGFWERERESEWERRRRRRRKRRKGKERKKCLINVRKRGEANAASPHHTMLCMYSLTYILTYMREGCSFAYLLRPSKSIETSQLGVGNGLNRAVKPFWSNRFRSRFSFSLKTSKPVKV